MKELNLTKILAGCPEGTPLYSPLFGKVTFKGIEDNEKYPILVDTKSPYGIASFTATGTYHAEACAAECLLFPSKDCRDWSQFKQSQQDFQKGDHIVWHNNDGNEFFGVFLKYTEDGQGVARLLHGINVSDWDVFIKDLTKVEKFDPKRFKTGDAVLVRDFVGEEWEYALFSHVTKMGDVPYFKASSKLWNKCIPYNIETKHLVGKTEKEPEFYDSNMQIFILTNENR